MKCTLDAASLRDLAEWCARIAPAKPPAPILAAVLLDVTADGISATVTDYDRFGRAELDATSDTEMRLAVSARALASVAGAAAEPGNARLELVSENDGKLRLTCRGLKASLPLMPAEDFPPWPAVSPARHRAISGALLGRAMEVAANVAHDSTVPGHDVVRLESSPDGLRLVATDRYRLPIADLPWLEATDVRYHGEVSLPASSAKAVAVMVRDVERVLLGFPEANEGQSLLVAGPHRTLMCRLGGSDYVKYQPLIPPPQGRTWTADRDELAKAAKRVSALAAVREDKARHLICTVGAGTLTLSAMSEDSSMSDGIDVEHSAEWDDDGWPFAVNAAFLADMALAIPARRVTFTSTTPAKPILVTPADGETSDYPAHGLIMPIRIKEGA